MTSKNIYRELGGLDPDLIAKAAPDAVKKKSANKTWVKWGAMAACLCLIVVGGWRLGIAFTKSQMTDSYREGTLYELSSLADLPAEFSTPLLVEKLELSEGATAELYYTENGTPTNTNDWYSLLISDHTGEYDLTVYCLLNSNKTLDEWKVSMVFTKDATSKTEINGTTVQIALNEYGTISGFDYWYYAIFEKEGVVYDVRVKCNDADTIYDILNVMLNE